MFLTISYLSSASEMLSNDDIVALMTETKDFNDANKISGILIYSDHTFFQVLEGDFNVVKPLYNKIQEDYRHYNVFKILETKSSERKYHRYGTKFLTLQNNEAATNLQKLIAYNDEHVSDQKLHSLVVYQSSRLMNLK